MSLLYSRASVVNLANSWVGLKESDGSYREIIDIYNSHRPLPRGLKMQYNWSWCACTWSAIAIKLGYTDIMPVEISCGEIVKLAQRMGIWQENDGYVPEIGGGILYDWDDTGRGDNIGWPDHIGTITYVNPESGYFVVTEGNYGNAVKKRTVSVNGKYIRGFITPRYADQDDTPINPVEIPDRSNTEVAHEVIAGQWGSGNKRKQKLTSAGYDYEAIQKEVNKILNGSAIKAGNPSNLNQSQMIIHKITATCSAKKFNKKLAGTYEPYVNLYCRNDAGTNKKALCVVPAGLPIKNYGYYNTFNGTEWLYIQFAMDGVQYTGFCSSTYLHKV